MQDPFRQNAQTASDADLTALIETGEVSAREGRRALFEESQVTDRVLGFIQSDNRRAFDDQQARVFGEQYANRLTPEQANERYGVEGHLKFDEPVNETRAAEMNRQATLRRFREETAARADLSALDSIGASVIGGATDPVMLPTWFIGGGSAAVRGLGVAAQGSRGANIARGAAVGVIDGLAGGVAAETINAGARLSTGEDYTGGDALRNIVFGTALGGVIGGSVGAVAPTRAPAARRTGSAARVADLIGEAARRRGENPATALRIAEIESGLDPRADNPASSASGVFQFLTGRGSAWRRMGGGDPFDASLNVSRGIDLLAENRTGLRRQLGREPQEWELYLAHQQGQGGAFELLRDPNRPAVDALRAAGVADPDAAIRLNGGRADMTAGQFAGKWRRKFGQGGDQSGASIEDLTPPRPPRPTDGLTDNERVGAFTESLEAIAADAPVDLGAMLARNGLDALDEASAVPSIRGRWLEADAAVTRRGSEIPVRFAVVELGDLKTSHTDDLYPEAAYPAALQPRDRARAGSQAENYNLERDLNPALLMRDKAASGGAPIVSPDGLVESGNGRTIALRRSAMTGTDAWGRYQAELARQGIDTAGFERPVLVRMRSEPMTGAGRADMARELNVSQTEGFSPVEQAKADARRLDADTLGLIDGDDAFAAGNRPFLKGFVSRVAPNDANALTDAAGALSLSGKARVQAALVQRAYGDEALTAALFETADANVRGIGQALADAAPAWARMRAEAPAGLDITENLTGAVALVREARASRMSVGELFRDRLGQTDMFGGEAISPETEALIRLMFRDEAMTKPRAADRIAEALKDYARGAAATPAGPDLFGVQPDGRAFLETLRNRYALAEGEGQRGLAYAGGTEPAWTTREAEPAGLDLRPAEPVVERPGGASERQGDRAPAADVGGRLTPEARLAALIADDPELKALLADTEALAQANGIDMPTFDKSTEPSTVAEAIRAAAFCLASDLVA